MASPRSREQPAPAAAMPAATSLNQARRLTWEASSGKRSRLLRLASPTVRLLSSMAGGAAGEALDAEARDQLPAQRELVRAGRPLHVGDLIGRPDVALGLTVAVEAPLHRQGRHLVDGGHLVDAA